MDYSGKVMNKGRTKLATGLTLCCFSLAGGASYAAEFEVIDRLSVDGYTILRGSADIPGGSFAVGGSTFVVKGGNAGIGTAVPNNKMDIVKTVTSNDPTTMRSLRFGVDANPGYSFYIGTGGLPVMSGVLQALDNGNPSNIILNPGGGNVGIGTTAPGNILQVTKNQNASTYIAVTNSDTTDLYSRARFLATGGTVNLEMEAIGTLQGYVGTTSNHNLGVMTNGQTRMTLDTSGNVGIGTTAPAGTLEISNSYSGTSQGGEVYVTNTYSSVSGPRAADLTFRLTDSVGSRKPVAMIQALSNNQDSSSGANILFYTRTADGPPTEKVRIDNNGNVGIGTASPAAALEVNGSVKFSGGSAGQYLMKGADGNLAWVSPALSCYNSYDGTNEYGGACNAGYATVFKANIYMMGIAQQWVRVCCKIQ